MPSARTFSWLLPLLLLLTAPLWTGPVLRFLDPSAGFQAVPPDPEARSRAEMEGVRFFQDKGGVRDWQLTARRLRSADGENLELDGVDALFHGSGEEGRQMSVSGEHGRYQTETRSLTLQGQVLLRAEPDYRMATENLEYREEDRELFAAGEVTVSGAQFEISGRDLRYDLTSRDFQLAGPVLCTLQDAQLR